MSLAELRSLGEFLGFFAVLATLMYLALQTKHSRDVANSQAARSVSVDFQAIWNTLGEDIERTEIIRYTKKQVLILYVMRSERELRNFVLEDRNDRGN